MGGVAAPDPAVLVTAVRRSHDRLAAIVEALTPAQLTGPSYASEWTVAQVLSHVGSQAELFRLLVDAGLSGGEAPGRETMLPIWRRWDALAPETQASESVAGNEQLVRHLESLDAGRLASLHVQAFGRDLDAVGLLRSRLSEHAIHTWDVAVMLDPAATVAPDSVAQLIDFLPEMAPRVGKPLQRPAVLGVTTSDPERRFALIAGGVGLEPWSGQLAEGSLQLPAEALFRLVYGRLDPAHTPPLELDSPTLTLADLRAVFPGF
ncbi:MAG: maleylpyruvate isomerase family mycothiol-dependent enzyme [Candidatus Dormibacteria bacterium]